MCIPLSIKKIIKMGEKKTEIPTYVCWGWLVLGKESALQFKINVSITMNPINLILW